MAEDITLRALEITELHTVLLASRTLEEFLEGALVRATTHGPPGTGATLTVHHRDGLRRSTVVSDVRVEACAATALEEGGPCECAVASAGALVIPDVARATRWPGWSRTTIEQGFASVAAIPQRIRSDAQLGLVLYSPEPDSWTSTLVATMTMVAEEIARSSALLLRSNDQAELNADLRAAISSRAVIDQALGVIMAENRCSAEDAFAILRSASQHRNVKVRDVAAAIIEAVTGRPPIPGTEFRAS